MSSEARLPLSSVSPNAERLATLKTLFPEVFTEGKVDFDRLKSALGEAIQTDRERYGLNWAGKTNAIHALQSLSVGALQPVREESIAFDTTENLIIEGDNLEVLKLLQKSYFGKVKMIYIDPPYNTGNEFIYPDNFREGLEDYLRYSGQMSAEGTATTSNKETDGRYHSKWLSMMYPRLFLAKNLLREDGVIFISIDDHEVHNFRLIMNEIFGEENFVDCIVWQKKVSPSNDAKWFSSDHEYLLTYAKSKEIWRPTRLTRTEKQKEYYKNPDNDPRGDWNSVAYTCNKSKQERPNLYYAIINPNTGEEVWPKETAVWAYSQSLCQQHIEENLLYWGIDGNAKAPRFKNFLSEAGDVVPRSVWLYSEVGHTQEGTSEFLKFFQEGGFDNPKPSRLIKRMLKLAMSDGSKDNIILDFFAGSGTTAQAVLELNKEDGGNRKFILVQLPEKTQNRQFPTIAHITRERVRRVIAKMSEADATRLNLSDSESQDRGFKAFRLAASNFKIWDGIEGETDADAIAAQLELFANNLLPDATPENILFEILLKAGYDLNAAREEVSIADQCVYSIAGGERLICLERTLTREAVAGMIARKPAGVLCLDEAFHGDDALLTNTLLQMQDAGILFQTI